MKKSILTNADVFNESFEPLENLCRKEHAKEILKYLKPYRRGKTQTSLYIFGPPGTGKTTTVKSVLKNNFPNDFVYINCWNNRTSHKIMEELVRNLGQIVHGRESTSELIKRFERSKKKQVLICLDEADQIKNTDIFYVFGRNSCSLILISNHPITSIKMDHRIKSGLQFQEINFSKYSSDQIIQILQDRITCGLDSDTIDDDMLAKIASSCSGDARAGIQILKNAAIEAESKNLGIITSQEIKLASHNARKHRLSYILNKLNTHQRVIYNLLKSNKTMNSGELFNEYKKQMNDVVTDRSYRNYMLRMVELGLIREISSGRWKKYSLI